MSDGTIPIETPVVNAPGRTVRLDYGRVRESWLDAPTAGDVDEDDQEATRLYAVSAARHGPWLHVRYIHPQGGVKTMHTSAGRNDDGTFYPRGLEVSARDDWPRSIVPEVDEGPDDVYRSPELQWLEELWGDRAELREVATA